MKKILIFSLLVLLLATIVSAELAYKFDLEEKDGELVLNSVNIVAVEDYDIVRRVIDTFLIVAGNETSYYSFI